MPMVKYSGGSAPPAVAMEASKDKNKHCEVGGHSMAEAQAPTTTHTYIFTTLSIAISYNKHHFYLTPARPTHGGPVSDLLMRN